MKFIQKNNTLNNKAFSLIELLTVVVIIGIVSSIGVMKYQEFVKETKAEVLQLILTDIKVAQRTCFYAYPLRECDSLAEIDVNLPEEYTTNVVNLPDLSRACFEVKNSVNQYGCYDSTDKKISTVENIMDSAKGKCDSSAVCL